MTPLSEERMLFLVSRISASVYGADDVTVFDILAAVGFMAGTILSQAPPEMMQEARDHHANAINEGIGMSEAVGKARH